MLKYVFAVALPLAGSAAAGTSLVVKASPVAAPCVAAALPLFQRTSGRPVQLQTTALGPARSAAGADVAVAADEELTHVIEGGAALPGVEADLAAVPWVFVGAVAAAPDVRALARSDVRVRVLGGAVARYARQSLETLPSERVQSVRDASAVSRLGDGELALVPLSIAGPGPVVSASVRPVRIRAVGLAASSQPERARAFVEFLASGAGNAAFRSCGRDDAR